MIKGDLPTLVTADAGKYEVGIYVEEEGRRVNQLHCVATVHPDPATGSWDIKHARLFQKAPDMAATLLKCMEAGAIADPELADEVRQILREAGLESGVQDDRRVQP